ncbi:hypothetical protein OH77DRAFT_1018479 [Trametes cingulata]|nr:hypothetical protein OH77DRAFT_1018479 [Trametes cingulata]
MPDTSSTRDREGRARCTKYGRADVPPFLRELTRKTLIREARCTRRFRVEPGGRSHVLITKGTRRVPSRSGATLALEAGVRWRRCNAHPWSGPVDTPQTLNPAHRPRADCTFRPLTVAVLQRKCVRYSRLPRETITFQESE